MKKIFFILTAALSLCLLTSCVLEAKVVVTPDYDITCYNNTDGYITDWCVKRNDYTTYANSDYNCSIGPWRRDTIRDLPPGDYQIFFTFKPRGKIHEWDYESTFYFYLDEDVTFYVRSGNIYGDRSATNEKADEEPEYVLVCSNGKEYPLTKAN